MKAISLVLIPWLDALRIHALPMLHYRSDAPARRLVGKNVVSIQRILQLARLRCVDNHGFRLLQLFAPTVLLDVSHAQNFVPAGVTSYPHLPQLFASYVLRRNLWRVLPLDVSLRPRVAFSGMGSF